MNQTPKRGPPSEKDRCRPDESIAGTAVRNLFYSLQEAAPETFPERAKKEVENEKELYANLEQELADATEHIPELKPLLHPPEES